MIDTPEWDMCRRSMLERTDYDPLSQKTITIYKSKDRSTVRNRSGNPVSIATYTYKHSTTKEELESSHDMVVQAILSGDFATEDYAATLTLRMTIEDYYNAKNSAGRPSEQDTHTESGTERLVT